MTPDMIFMAGNVHVRIHIRGSNVHYTVIRMALSAENNARAWGWPWLAHAEWLMLPQRVEQRRHLPLKNIYNSKNQIATFYMNCLKQYYGVFKYCDLDLIQRYSQRVTSLYISSFCSGLLPSASLDKPSYGVQRPGVEAMNINCSLYYVLAGGYQMGAQVRL